MVIKLAIALFCPPGNVGSKPGTSRMEWFYKRQQPESFTNIDRLELGVVTDKQRYTCAQPFTALEAGEVPNLRRSRPSTGGDHSGSVVDANQEGAPKSIRIRTLGASITRMIHLVNADLPAIGARRAG